MQIKNILLILLFPFIFNSCVIIKELIPKTPSESFYMDSIKKYAVKTDDISEEMFYVKGFNEPHTPPNVPTTKNLEQFLTETEGSINLNRSHVIKYSNRNNKKTEKIIIMIPGIYSGAGTLSNLSISLAKRLPETEIWIWERRSNQLEDRRIILKALDEKNKNMLLDLFEKNSFKLKDKNKAFYQPSTEDISFAGYWGLDVMLYDLFYVIKEARKKNCEITLAGYSLGAIYATLFSANVFVDESREIPGYSMIDKVMLLDGPPMIDGYINSEATYKSGATIIPYNIIEGKDKLESGKYYPCNASVQRDMSMFFVIDLQAALAQIAPNDISIENYQKLPIDNLAKYLIAFDDNYSFFKLFTATFGRAEAKHSGKFNYTSTVQVIDLAPGKDHISWIPREKNDPVEFNDYKEYLKAANSKLFNMAEWYQPTKILLDIGSIHHNDTSSGWQKKYFRLTENKRINNPFLCIGLTRGLMSNINSYLEYEKLTSSKDFTVVMINNITHLDGNTIDDLESRPVMADVIANWLNGKEIADKNSKAFYKN